MKQNKTRTKTVTFYFCHKNCLIYLNKDKYNRLDNNNNKVQNSLINKY